MSVRVIGASDAVQLAGSPVGVPPEHAEVGGGPRRCSLLPFKVAPLKGCGEGAGVKQEAPTRVQAACASLRELLRMLLRELLRTMALVKTRPTFSARAPPVALTRAPCDRARRALPPAASPPA